MVGVWVRGCLERRVFGEGGVWEMLGGVWGVQGVHGVQGVWGPNNAILVRVFLVVHESTTGQLLTPTARTDNRQLNYHFDDITAEKTVLG